MKKLLLILLCSTFLFSGCITTKLYSTANRCETGDCIQMNFGPPTDIQKNGEFGEVWTYGSSMDNSNSGIKQETNIYINSSGYDQGWAFKVFIDKNNNIYRKDFGDNKVNTVSSTLLWTGIITLGICIPLISFATN